MPTHYHGTPEEELALNTFIKLTRSVNALEARLTTTGTMGDLTSSQFGVLEALHHLGSLSQSELAARLLKSGGNITLVIDNLEKRGLVQRQRCETDRRVIYITLTQAGQELIAGLFPRHLASIVQALSALSADEQQQLGGLCRKLGKTQIVNLNSNHFQQ